MITPERRAALLEGSRFGLPNVSETCPRHFADRICEIRAALVEKRAEPAPTREYVRAAERRCALLERTGKFVRNLFPTRASSATARRFSAGQTLDSLSQRSGIPVERLQDAELRCKAAKLGAEIRAEKIKHHRAAHNVDEEVDVEICPMCGQPLEDDVEDITDEDIRNLHRELFPWEVKD